MDTITDSLPDDCVITVSCFPISNHFIMGILKEAQLLLRAVSNDMTISTLC